MANEDLTATGTTTIADLQGTVQDIIAKSDNAVNRLRCNNIWVLGLPKGEEGNCPAEFKVFQGLTEVSPTYVVKRALQVPTSRAIARNNPRPFLVRFLNHQIEMILSEACKHRTLQHGNASVLLYPDFSAELHRKRKIFNDVRRWL